MTFSCSSFLLNDPKLSAGYRSMHCHSLWQLKQVSEIAYEEGTGGTYYTCSIIWGLYNTETGHLTRVNCHSRKNLNAGRKTNQGLKSRQGSLYSALAVARSVGSQRSILPTNSRKSRLSSPWTNGVRLEKSYSSDGTISGNLNSPKSTQLSPEELKWQTLYHG
ncbi:hypothetical protein BDV41DRAFT_402263 [Aspergillus transmontanensis]|uniref:Uncharacterized protein n=1 Tax=Aspergillus transmontanensis TaxID=1034304 RepID=A0A5N6VNN0_9EURO|nr:hypothetical protein BDV41DRAFT_402263 [Aspergillus transmontanensis]